MKILSDKIESKKVQKAKKIVQILLKSGYKAYFAGGCVRDFIMGYEPHDIDIATSARPEIIKTVFPRTLEVGAAFGIIKVLLDNEWFEVGTFREEDKYVDGRHPELIRYCNSPERDAKRRDFTVNGLFLDPLTNKVIDFVGGVKDIKRGILRTIGHAEKKFSEDYLRILRAVRFAIRFGFTIESDTFNALCTYSSGLTDISAERISEELNKIFTGKRPDKALILMSDTGILKTLLPEIECMKNIPQPKKFHPEGDVFTHVCLMLSHMAWKTIPLAWSVLLHDVGKPKTLTIKDNTEHFYRHNAVGAEIAKSILKRLKMPIRLIQSVSTAVRRHMSYADIQRMRPAKLRRLVADENFPLELELHRLDCMASHKKLNNYYFLLDFIGGLNNEPKLPPPLITGKDLLNLGLRQGPKIGKILNIVSNLQLENKLTTREDALKMCKTLIKSEDS